MPAVTAVDVFVVVVAAIGLAGGIAVVAGRWARLNRLVWLGVVASLFGFGSIIGIRTGLISPVVLHRTARALTPVPLVRGGMIDNGYEQLLLDEAERGRLSVKEFDALLSMQAFRSIGSRGGMSLLSAVDRVRDGRLPGAYVDALADHLIAAWPAWRVTGNEMDEVPKRLLLSDAISEATRARFAAFIVKQYAAGPGPPNWGWTEALDEAILHGRLSPDLTAAYLRQLPEVELRLLTTGDHPWCGDVAVCALAQPASAGGLGRRDSSLPWKGRVVLRSGGAAFEGLDIGIRGWWYDFREPAPLAHVLLPDEPGEHTLTAELTVELTRDDLYAWWLRNPAHAGPASVVEQFADVRVTRPLTLTYRARRTAQAPPAFARGEDAARQVRESLLPGQSAVQTIAGDARAFQHLAVKNPPVTLAMDMLWVVGDREVRLGWFLAREGQNTPVRLHAPLGGTAAGPTRLVLRPNLSLIRAPLRVTTVYDGPPIEIEIKSYTRTGSPW